MKKIFNDPKRNIEYMLNIALILLVYLYIYVYQGILIFQFQVDFIGLNVLQIPIVSVLVIPLVHYLFIKSDPLQRSPSNLKAIRFFQREFPSRYLLERCKNCKEDQSTCINYVIDSSVAGRYWFRDIFHGQIEKQNQSVVSETFSKGYTCKLVYYLTWSLFSIGALGLITVISDFIYAKAVGDPITTITWEILFPIVCFVLVGLITMTNKVDINRPTGCWQAWREVNSEHWSWMRDNEAKIQNIICHRGGGVKSFSGNLP
jgi:hypothetical protein